MRSRRWHASPYFRPAVTALEVDSSEGESSYNCILMMYIWVYTPGTYEHVGTLSAAMPLNE